MKKILTHSGVGLAAAITLSLLTPCAHANLELSYSIDGGAPTLLVNAASGTTQSFCDDGSPGCGASLGGIFAVDGQIKSNSPGTPTLAKLLDSTLDIHNTSGGTHTIEFFAVDTDFTAPAAPPNPGVVIQSSVGGSVTTGDLANKLSLTSCVDAGNSQTACAGGSVVVGPGTPNVTGTPDSSFKDDKFATITSLGIPYSVSQDVTVTLSANSDINFADTTNLTPTPEPASMLLLGGLLLGTTRLLKRRKSA